MCWDRGETNYRERENDYYFPKWEGPIDWGLGGALQCWGPHNPGDIGKSVDTVLRTRTHTPHNPTTAKLVNLEVCFLSPRPPSSFSLSTHKGRNERKQWQVWMSHNWEHWQEEAINKEEEDEVGVLHSGGEVIYEMDTTERHRDYTRS